MGVATMYKVLGCITDKLFMRDALPLFNFRYLMRLSASFVAVSLILAGCSSAPPATRPSTGAELTVLEQGIKAINDGNLTQADSLLARLDLSALSSSDYLNYLLASARLHLQLNEPDLAKLFLDDAQPLVEDASKAQERDFIWLKAQHLEATGQYFAAARLRDAEAKLFSDEQAEDNFQAIWFDLLRIPEADLVSGQDEQTSSQFEQWLQLAAIARNNRITLDEQLKQIELWQQRYSRHPAAHKLPKGLGELQQMLDQRPEQIALLLPLSGSLEKTGKAIRDGFMASYYDSLNKGFKVPTVHIYDSAQTSDLTAIYAQAQFVGAQWVVGPVEKPKVQDLQERGTLPLPTLALNYGERSEKVNNNLYEFGLAAEDEAAQIADEAWAAGKRNVLALVPQGQWGERVYAAFEQRWLELGGNISDKRSYPKRQDYNPDIKALLNIDASQKRFNTVRMFFRDKVEFEPRRRQDADWIFLVALPQQARQIKPTLAFNFAADLPIYATSHIYSGEPNPAKDRDLNGIFYCDVPWLLQHSELYQQVDAGLPHGQGAYTRLYALGADAFRLLPQLGLLKTMPEYQVFGSTGALQLDDGQRIIRRSQCTVFRNGRPQRLSRNH